MDEGGIFSLQWGIKRLARHGASFSGLAASPHPLCDCQLQVSTCVKPNSEHLVPPVFALNRGAGDKPSMFFKNARESKTIDFLPRPKRNTTQKNRYGKLQQIQVTQLPLATPGRTGRRWEHFLGLLWQPIRNMFFMLRNGSGGHLHPNQMPAGPLLTHDEAGSLHSWALGLKVFGFWIRNLLRGELK